ncbi:hypothetical protein [Planococcus lenghuensis]|uniref:Uncharacterized protein n=1 Tax=Planococcus lenghuensis TaxID=2213202 RepID=A0A1Q2KZS5_9BACL|nr:hypothetical protein [Planococcus lenghuensis]AQQ53681.1 hypothetical protein B0X71_11725 [Planococcus lenghuensis]
MSMKGIMAGDLVTDEYGNFYQVVGTQSDEGEVSAIEIAHIYFQQAFQSQTDVKEAVGTESLGAYLQDLVNGYIEETKKNNRPIYAVRDLLVNNVGIYAMDITKPYPDSGSAQ